MKIKSMTAVFAALTISSTAALAVPENNKNANSQWLVDASKLEGTDVWDFHGNKLGGLQQVLIDPQTGRIRYGVMEVDKSWNWTDPQVAIPWDSFAVKRGDDMKTVISIDATKEKLQGAPKFKAGDADRLFSKEASQPIYSYWSIYWVEEPRATPTSNDNSSPASQSDANAPAPTNSTNDQGAATKPNDDATNQGGTSATTGSTSNADSPVQNHQTTSEKK